MTVNDLKEKLELIIEKGKGEYIVENRYWSRAGLERWEVNKAIVDEKERVVYI